MIPFNYHIHQHHSTYDKGYVALHAAQLPKALEMHQEL